MPEFTFDALPAKVRWPVVRGDDEDMPIYFFDHFVDVDHEDNVPRDITSDTFSASVVEGEGSGGVFIVHPIPLIVDGPAGYLSVTMTDTQTDLLVNSTYLWDLIMNPASAAEKQLITGRVTVTGRATP